MNILTTIMAHEELHTLNANVALKHFGIQPIQPCQYTFPASDFKFAVALASTFTDVVLGTLQDIETKLAMNGDFGLVRLVASEVRTQAVYRCRVFMPWPREQLCLQLQMATNF